MNNTILDNIYSFDKIFVDSNVINSKYTTRILDKLNSTNFEVIDSIYSLIKTMPIIYHPSERSKILYLGELKGDIVQKCPGSHGHICCNYSVINLYLGCPINCSYCILQSYLNQQFTVINTNLDHIFSSIDNFININSSKPIRIGTGELGDSLVYDYLTDYSSDFLDFFYSRNNATFEFKTKTVFIENLLMATTRGNIVIGFSVNPQSIIDSEEEQSASMKDRISAMHSLVKKNYRIALHFDPMIYIDNFQQEYGSLIDMIFNTIPHESIAWISLGTFRYTPDLKNSINYNYPNTKITDLEFVKCRDQKYRYFKPLRLKVYQFVYSKIKAISDSLNIYMCMESPDIWQRVTSSKEFDTYLFK